MRRGDVIRDPGTHFSGRSQARSGMMADTTPARTTRGA